MRKEIFGAAIAALLTGMTASPANADQINVYVHSDYGGSDRVLTGPVRDMNDIGFNDHVSSFIVKSGTWELCEHTNFRGRCITAGNRDPDLTRSGFNDAISSARPVRDRRGGRERDRERGRGRDEGGRWNGGGRGGIEIYQDANYEGPRRMVDGDIRNLQAIDFNDHISSIRIGFGTWEFCEHADFRGRCTTYDRDTNWVGNDVNDRITSIRRIR